MKANGVATIASYGLIVVAVWLGWEAVKSFVAERAPPSTAIRVAPNSPEVLRRAAESELASGRIDNAHALASESLKRAPFNARTLRVIGLVSARRGQEDQADSLLTLAGNWSLRDDPAHGWLIQRRLRQGNYDSAFGHADTLARRWVDGNDRIFELFTLAVLADQRATSSLAALVARKPSWRAAFLIYLIERADADPVLLALGVALAENPGGYSNEELSWIYQSWYYENRFAAIRELRQRLGRPGGLDDIQNGDFSEPAGAELLPFGWRRDPISGVSSGLLEDDVRPAEIALRVDYDGYATGVVTEQILMLPPGQHLLSGQDRVEIGPDTSRLRWRLSCIESGQLIGSYAVAPMSGDGSEWRTFQVPFVTPSAGCAVQRLRLEADPGDRRETTVAWFDKLKIDQPVRALTR